MAQQGQQPWSRRKCGIFEEEKEGQRAWWKAGRGQTKEGPVEQGKKSGIHANFHKT